MKKSLACNCIVEKHREYFDDLNEYLFIESFFHCNCKEDCKNLISIC